MTNLEKALRRLEKSNTALKRRNARRVFRSAVYDVLKKYPAYTTRTGAKKPFCPLCKVPKRTWRVFLEHLKSSHSLPWRGSPFDCPCCNKMFQNSSRVARHLCALAARGKLDQHVIMAATEQALGVKGEN